MTEYYAHSENGKNEKHSLSKHLLDSAQLAETFACLDEYKPIFRIASLLHDLGKYQPAFQDYLINGGRRGSVPHASWGAGYARILKALEASFAIDGHHKGLPDAAAWKSDTERFKRLEVLEFEKVRQAFIGDLKINESDFSNDAFSIFGGEEKKFQREVFIRYLFSALTDSDWLSTEEHFEPEKTELRAGGVLPIDEMVFRLEAEFSSKSTNGDINQLRNEGRKHALDKALLPSGFYSLALPTGMGKTLTSMAWALHHARHNGLKRIIIVLPYISIIDQTAQELKRIFGEEWVLEHHSSYNEGDNSKDTNENLTAEQKRKQLACENWDFPAIVTTTVQFFESLFSNKPSRCRKNHNIAEAVVIFDEVQSIPKEIILPTLQMLKDVHEVMKTSFLFCTATQPAYEKRPGFDGIDSIMPLIEDPGNIYDVTRRVTYNLLDNLAPIDNGRLSEAVMGCDDSALVIFNTKKAALEFHIAMTPYENWEEKYHLSTAMCPSHRKEVIERIRADLKANRKILVASTQLIEAGVDFDFPVVFRAVAPLEAIIQSAGRCNREGGMNGYGNVVLFKLKNSKMPDKTYEACAGFAEELIKNDINRLYRHDVFEKYYADVVDLYIDQSRQQGINNARKEFNFETVNDAYHLIKDATEGLFIYNYNEDSRQLLHSLEYKEFLSRADYRRMQVYTVQVYEYFILQNASMCKLMPQGFRVWYGNYDDNTGISIAPIEADKLVL
ncbi:MAG: CRISPR-associated helicase Cas3' [Nitrospiraceae bacterium]|nr:CRISPR-associated helicase Cas3' [Nitrospiraceae bacterium]